MAIAKETIDQVKRTTDLVALVKARGITLKKNGKGYFGLCPFHDDKNPSLSINPEDNLWQCFGCGAAGDVIRFVELIDQVDFKEAINRLSDKDLKTLPPKRQTARPRKKGLTAKLRKLLNRVIEFYHTAIGEDPRAHEYLEKRAIGDKAVLSAHKAGFANGTLLNVLPDDGVLVNQLKQIGILNSRGKEHFYGCVTLPLYTANGDPAGMYGRRIDDMSQPGSANHLYLPGPRQGLFNRQAAKSHKEIILTESVIDSLTLINAGIANTIPCYGVNGLTEDHLAWFRQCSVETLYICFDPDESGSKGAAAVSERIRSEGFRTHIVNLPDDRDINDFFLLTADPATAFNELLVEANPKAKAAVKEEKNYYRATDYGFAAMTGGRRYEVRGITRRDTRLKATVKGIAGAKTKQRFHVDTVDFYSARSRAFLVKGLCELFGEDEAHIVEDMQTLMEYAEAYRPGKERNERQGQAAGPGPA